MILRHETSDVEQVTALARLACASEDARVDLSGRPPPRLVAELVCLGERTVAQSSGSVGWVVGVGTVLEAVLCVPLAGGGEPRVHGERLTLELGRRGALMGPGAAVRMNLGEGWRMASIKLPRAHLEGQLQARMGEPTALPRLEPALRLDGPEAEVGRLAQVLADVAVREPRAGPVVVSLAEALGEALLRCQPALAQALDAQAAGTPVHLRRAAAWLEAHLYGPVSMTELATDSGLGLRSLQRLCLARRGVGPLGFLQGLRLAHPGPASPWARPTARWRRWPPRSVFPAPVPRCALPGALWRVAVRDAAGRSAPGWLDRARPRAPGIRGPWRLTARGASGAVALGSQRLRRLLPEGPRTEEGASVWAGASDDGSRSIGPVSVDLARGPAGLGAAWRSGRSSAGVARRAKKGVSRSWLASAWVGQP